MRIACLLADEFEDSEYRIPVDHLRSAGHDVVIIGKDRGQRLHGKRGKETVTADLSIDEVMPEDFGVLFIPGGHSPDNLRADPRFVDFVAAFDETGKLIAAVCHGPQLLLSADRVKGRRMTAWRTVQADLERAGADVVDEPVVVEGNLLTSRQPGDLEMFSQAILDRVGRPAVGAAAPPP